MLLYANVFSALVVAPISAAALKASLMNTTPVMREVSDCGDTELESLLASCIISERSNFAEGENGLMQYMEEEEEEELQEIEMLAQQKNIAANIATPPPLDMRLQNAPLACPIAVYPELMSCVGGAPTSSSLHT
jgi:hypothetical protein